MTDIKQEIQKETENARTVCSTEGSSSGDCAAAWDAVEELQAEASHQREKEVPKTGFEKYCDENPDAVECRVYDD
ncbi:Calvin cycle protein CP12 [Crocosphaera sp.]|uniref:Calvin cycle protein CP12 n=1 Tax=Crocosphaera sp. TaxID=2729996 RepID=UPI002603D233|nr:Calvin cycle protein CP12 [Crocosphaera sp.]MDJ0579353.1 Calvin cycle protein CP12 [Crocosphaera sp.]